MKRMITLIFSLFSFIAAVFGMKWATPYNPADYETETMANSVIVGEMRVEL